MNNLWFPLFCVLIVLGAVGLVASSSKNKEDKLFSIQESVKQNSDSIQLMAKNVFHVNAAIEQEKNERQSGDLQVASLVQESKIEEKTIAHCYGVQSNESAEWLLKCRS